MMKIKVNIKVKDKTQINIIREEEVEEVIMIHIIMKVIAEIKITVEIMITVEVMANKVTMVQLPGLKKINLVEVLTLIKQIKIKQEKVIQK